MGTMTWPIGKTLRRKYKAQWLLEAKGEGQTGRAQRIFKAVKLPCLVAQW